MDREANKEIPPPSLLSNPSTNYNKTIKDDSSRKFAPPPPSPSPPPQPPPAGGNGGGGDRLKRDEWSEGAVSCLLEAYESKWTLRNRAKLKGQDWEDVAKYVSARADSTKSAKTQTQCKNKIESMKKRYRSESAIADASSWPLYPRLDLLLRGNPSAPPSAAAAALVLSPVASQPIQTVSPLAVSVEPSQPPAPLSSPAAAAAALPLGHVGPNPHDSNGHDRIIQEDEAGVKTLPNIMPDKNQAETDSSTPALYSEKEKMKSKSMKTRVEKKKRKREGLEISESIRWLAEVVVRSEQARMETMREVERMRAEAEAKRGEMDLKRTEIIANTQLEIAKLFAGIGKGVDSSLRIGRS